MCVYQVCECVCLLVCLHLHMDMYILWPTLLKDLSSIHPCPGRGKTPTMVAVEVEGASGTQNVVGGAAVPLVPHGDNHVG